MMKILVADDEPSIRGLVRRILEEKGYEIHEAVNGKDAWEKFQELRPPVVMTDLNMPEMTGEELVRKIHELAPSTMCIVLTGYGSLESARKVIGTGCREYLLKPVRDPEMITLAVERCLEDRKRLERYVLERKLSDAKSELLNRINDQLIDSTYSLSRASGLLLDRMDCSENGESLALMEDISLNVHRLVEIVGKLQMESDGIKGTND